MIAVIALLTNCNQNSIKQNKSKVAFQKPKVKACCTGKTPARFGFANRLADTIVITNHVNATQQRK